MIALVQRVSRAEVRVAGTSTGAIARGLLVLVCASTQWLGQRSWQASGKR